MRKLTYTIKTARELGVGKTGLFALYRLGMRSGFFARATKNVRLSPSQLDIYPILQLPSSSKLASALGKEGQAWLLDEAREVVDGRVRIFGGKPVPLQLSSPDKLVHWSTYEQSTPTAQHPGEEAGDIKFAWEPARFCWAYTLGRAYRVSRDEQFPLAFWKYWETFIEANPPYLGVHWVSAQEAALRLMAFVFGAQVFRDSPQTTPSRLNRMAGAIAAHAERIPPTLIYARAQNNNHLLSEAAGLYTAGLAIPDHPKAKHWESLGWRWFQRGLASQIARDGTYMQHSSNYHRLMLQLALWMQHLAHAQGKALPKKSLDLLAAGTRWLIALLDPVSGCVPNLGPNDGAYIMPLTTCPFNDYRPVLRAASHAFLGKHTFTQDTDDEMRLWLCNTPEKAISSIEAHTHHLGTPLVLQSRDKTSWAYLRAVHFNDRPGHADQLHIDLWWRGLNVAQDAGTYLYNAPAPWDNALTHTSVHNTISVDGQDQMTRASRFLYLDWAQAEVIACERLEGRIRHLTAWHTGYQRLGVRHERTVTISDMGKWLIEDHLLPTKTSTDRLKALTLQLHWLLPDWPWEVDEQQGKQVTIKVESPLGSVSLQIVSEIAHKEPNTKLNFWMVRASTLVHGSGEVNQTWGWHSPTYGKKLPALSLRAEIKATLPAKFISQWQFPMPHK